MILGVDPATVCGWCALGPGAPPRYGAMRIGAPNAELGEVLHDWRDFLMSLIDEVGPAVIVFEAPYIPTNRAPKFGKAVFAPPMTFDGGFPVKPSGPPPLNAKTVTRLACFAGLIEMVAYECQIRVEYVTSMQATKFLTGKGSYPGGRAQKKAATVAMCRRMGWPVKNDNEADAIAIALLAESILYPQAARIRWQAQPSGPLFTGGLTFQKSPA